MDAAVIDVHAHLWSHKYFDLLEEAGVQDLSMYRNLGATASPVDLEKRFELMDQAAIDLQVLSAVPLVPHLTQRDSAVALADFVNDEYARLVDQHSKRFRVLLALPLPHIEASPKALERLAEPQFLGVAVTTDILGTPLTDPRFNPLFEELDARGTTVLMHPVGADARSQLIAQRPMRWSVDAPLEDTIAVADLLLTGHLSRFSNLKIISTHLGGALPMLLPRLQAQQPWEAPDVPEDPRTATQRLWFDTVTHVNPAAIRAAVEVLGADHLVLGTDFPFQAAGELPADVALLSRLLSAQDALNVRSANAAQLFPKLVEQLP